MHALVVRFLSSYPTLSFQVTEGTKPSHTLTLVHDDGLIIQFLITADNVQKLFEWDKRPKVFSSLLRYGWVSIIELAIASCDNRSLILREENGKWDATFNLYPNDPQHSGDSITLKPLSSFTVPAEIAKLVNT